MILIYLVYASLSKRGVIINQPLIYKITMWKPGRKRLKGQPRRPCSDGQRRPENSLEVRNEDHLIVDKNAWNARWAWNNNTYFSTNNVKVSGVYCSIVLSTLSLNQINFSHSKLGFAKFTSFFLSRNAMLKN